MTALPAGGKTLSVRIGGRRISATLAGYIARTFMIWFGIMAFSVSSIIVLASGLDTLNNLAGRVEVSFFSSVYFAFLKLPFLFQETLPFLALFASLGTFWRLVRSHELVTMRAVGVSVWQFLTPVIGCAVLIGVVGTAARRAARGPGARGGRGRGLRNLLDSGKNLEDAMKWLDRLS